jgi:hypothetical protein
MKSAIREEIKSRLNWGNACDHSVQSVLSSRLLSKNVKIKILRTIFLPVVWYGCEPLSFILKEENGQSVFENRVLKKIFGSKQVDFRSEWRILHSETLYKYYQRGKIKENIMFWAYGRVYVWGGGKVILGSDGEAWGKETTWKIA